MRTPFARFAGLILAVLAVGGLYATAFSEETPVGILSGHVLADDTGNPIPGATLIVRPAVPRSGRDSHYVTAGQRGRFELSHLAAGAYQVEVNSAVYQSQTVPVAVREGETVKTDIRLTPGAPFLNLEVHQRAYLPDESPRMALHGFRQGDSVQLRMFSMPAAPLFLERGQPLRELLRPIPSAHRVALPDALKSNGGKQVREWTHRVVKRDAEGVFYEYESLGRLQPGLYVLTAQGKATRAVAWLLVTDLALITKSASGHVMAFTVNLRTGTPVPGAELTFFRGRNPVSHATTDATGRTETQIVQRGSDSVTALARRGSSLAFMDINSSGEALGEQERYRVFTYTDRPVYRPGHHVYFKGIVRHLETIGYSVPSPRPIHVKVEDDQETAIYEGDAAMTGTGSFAGEFDLPKEAKGGSYVLTAQIEGEQHTATFSVLSYRKPEWRVDVTFPQKHYVRGETVPVSVSAQYYYGAPVVNGKVHYTVYRSRYPNFFGDDDLDYEPEPESGSLSGDEVTTGTLTTDADGTAHFDFSTAEPKKDASADRFLSGMYQYNVEAEVTDLSDRVASGNGSVEVSAGEFALDARTEHSVAKPGDTVTITGEAKDAEQKPVAGVSVTATVTVDQWDGKHLTEKVVTSQVQATDPKGHVTFPLRLDQRGLMMIRLSAKDARGNTIDAMTDVWVTSAEGGDYIRNYPILSLVPDRKQYRIGDTAQILVNTDKPGSQAIVAVEGDRVLDLRYVPLKSKSTVLRFPIKNGYEPNVYVAACFVKDHEFVTTRIVLHVNAENHRLQVQIESDRQSYHPGDTATFHVRTLSASGKPIRAEVSLGVVDEAVYAIREDSKRALWDAFYPRRQDLVLTEFSYPQIYLGDADKDGTDVAVRKKFPDTAYWNPFLQTDVSGRATVSFRLPDNLTSWRATAMAVTGETGVGRATYNIRVAKELTLRLETPRSLTQGDHLSISAIAHNYTPTAQDVAVELQAKGVALNGTARQTRHLQPNEAAKLTWEAVAESPGTASFTAIARAGTYSDGMALTVPIRAFAREQVLYRTGAVSDDSAAEEWDRDPGAISGGVEIRLSPTLAGTMIDSLDYLATYPHGCTEQTMSSFLPDVVVTRALHDLGTRKPALETQLPGMTRAGLLRLYRYQHDDGGWGWWEYDETDHWMTAYVLFGLNLARRTGVELNKRVYESAIEAAKRLAGEPKLTADEAMFLAYALAETGAREPAHKLLERFAKDTPKLQVRSAGYRVLALLATGDPEDRAQAAPSLQALWALADSSGGVFHWTEKRGQFFFGIPEDVESTAVVLKAAVAVDPGDPRLAGVVRWLLLKRRGNQWESTRDTAWILFALLDYLKATGELHPEYDLTVQLNGKPLHSGHVQGTEAATEEIVLRVPLADLAAQNRLEVRASGHGTVYYSVRFAQTVHSTAFPPESTVTGLTVEREYYRMETRKDASGNTVTLPAKHPARQFSVGDRILVRLKIHADHPQEYLMLEEPLPAGCEVQDRGDLARADWDYWWAHQDVRDDRINFFIRFLEPGTHVIEYYLRPEAEGQVRALPSQLSDMYVPSVRASTSESKLEVGRG